MAERVIYSWNWPGAKLSPDYDVIQPLGQEIAELTVKEVGDGNYHFAASGSMRGNAHDWTYTQTGCIQYLIEVGTDNMQPDDIDLIEDTIGRNLPGAYHLMKRAAGSNIPPTPDKYQVTGIVSNSQTEEPLEGVEVIIEEMDTGVLSPRLTDEFGRYRRLLYIDSYNLTFKKVGYEDVVYEGLVPSADIVTELDISMNPKNNYILTIDMNLPFTHNDSIVFYLTGDMYEESSRLYNSDNIITSIPSGNYTLKIVSNDILPLIQSFYIDQDMELEAPLYWYNVILQDDFNSLDNWEIICGDWNVEDDKLLSQEDLVYPNYTPVCPIRINTYNEFYSETDEAILELTMMRELEWDRDTLFFDIYNLHDSLRVVDFEDQNWIDETSYHKIELNESGFNKLSIGIVSDITIGYRGLSLDRLGLVYQPSYECLLGDLNHDGSLLVTDIIVLLNIILNNQEATGFQQCSGDKRIDQNLDILDVISIINEISGD